MSDALRWSPRFYVRLYQHQQDKLHALKYWTGKDQNTIIRQLIELAHKSAEQVVNAHPESVGRGMGAQTLESFLPGWYYPNYNQALDDYRALENEKAVQKIAEIGKLLDDLRSALQSAFAYGDGLPDAFNDGEEDHLNDLYSNLMAAIERASEIGAELDQLRQFRRQELTWLKTDAASLRLIRKRLDTENPGV